MITQVLHCPYCQGIDIVRHSTTPEGKQRYRCRECQLGRGVRFCWTILISANRLR